MAEAPSANRMRRPRAGVLAGPREARIGGGGELGRKLQAAAIPRSASARSLREAASPPESPPAGAPRGPRRPEPRNPNDASGGRTAFTQPARGKRFMRRRAGPTGVACDGFASAPCKFLHACQVEFAAVAGLTSQLARDRRWRWVKFGWGRDMSLSKAGRGAVVAALLGAAFLGASATESESASHSRVAQIIVESIVQEVAMAAIRAAVERIEPMSDADFKAAYENGLREVDRIRSDPNPSLRDCNWDVYQWLNPKCANTPP